MQITIKKIKDIKVGWRNRHYDLAKTKELAESIKEIGLLHPIIIDADNNLIAGLHRLEAAKLLGWKEIPCSVVKLSEEDTELAEIDENLIRAELTELEKADLLCRAKEIYELRHPESSKIEKIKKNLRQFTDNDKMSLSDKVNNYNGLRDIKGFTENTADKISDSTRSIQRLMQISKNIAPDVKEQIKDTPIADSKTELLSLARVEPEMQREIINVIGAKKAKRVKEAVYYVKKDKFQTSLKKAELATATEDSMPADDVKVSEGDIFQLGDHILICGDNTDPAVIEYLRQFHFSFCFADPPYNLGVADYDKGNFVWTQDYLTEISDIVAVTPGINNMQSFFKKTEMAYKWGVICYVKNLKSGCAIGYTHYYPIVLFTNLRVANFGIKDLFTIMLPPMPESDRDIAFKRQKPAALLTYLINSFTREGDLILDPFAGSGQTLMVCEALGRKCVTVEILPDMIEQIISRWNRKYPASRAQKVENIYN